MTDNNFLPSGITSSDDFEVVKHIDVGTISTASLSTLKEFQETHQQVFFTPAIPYAWFYENDIDFDPLFSDLPERYRKHIKKLTTLPAPIIDGFYGNLSFWNQTVWVIPAELWIPFCERMGGKGFFDTEKKLVVLFSMGVCNAEDVLAKLKGKHPGLVSIAHIGLHTNKYSIVMGETVNTTTLAITKLPPDPCLVSFANKFMKEDSSAADSLALKPRTPSIISPPEIYTPKDLTRAQRRRYVELSELYRQIFDDRSPEIEVD